MTGARAGALEPELTAHAEAWESLGRLDPLWAILTEPDRRGRRWTEEDFLATGRREAADILGIAAHLGRPVAYGTALDFGCGVGRLTIPIADRFETVLGVDVSRAMVERARSTAAGTPNATFRVLGPGDRVAAADRSFDLVLSLYVL
jgi:2-polyprenyl-3-methyl-5-hydroxy-6-metoxy-1,4-benzoquinol methylase